VPQAFFKAGEDGLLVAAFEIDDAVGVQPGLRKRRRKQVQSRETPEHFAARAGGDPCGKKRGGRAVNRSVAAASNLMQRAKRQRPAREPSVHRGDTEGQQRCCAPVLALDLADLGAQTRGRTAATRGELTSRVG
jgi:hypothetical protein